MTSLGRELPNTQLPEADVRWRLRYFIGIGADRSTAIAVTLFCGAPSITRLE
jgi:hypothetical protein